ncbi:MAG: ATP-binding protein [Bacilli bacterium]|nr:ATP-binding protein [Bacilli bacterium]
MNRRESYKVKATVDNIELAIDPVIEALEEIDVSPKVCYQIRLALDEIITNVVSYAYESDDGEVEIRYEINDDPHFITISVIDSGKPFDPLNIEEPDINAAAEERRIGGLGLFIVKKTMDEVSYHRENDQNILTIKKNI